MVSYLKKPTGSEEFQEIVDFLNVDNREQEITVTVDGKEFTITEASVRRHLQLADVDGISVLPTTEIFDQLSLMGNMKRGFSGEHTPLFPSMLAIQAEEGEEVGSSKRAAEAELDHEGSKRQKTNEASGSVQEQPALHVKYPIIDWEVYIEESKKYWKIIRVGNNTEAYQFFKDMLKIFDRDDLVMLWNLVKERFSSTEPIDDKERTLWVELKRLFEHNTDDTLWKL
ncbi:hypothetical protein Tco_0903674 [Tanacetum coccineum]